MDAFTTVAPEWGSLADTGSNIVPWLIVAAVVVVLGVAALVVGRIVRSRKTPPSAPGESDQISPDS